MLRKRIYLQRLSRQTDETIDRTVEPVELLLADPAVVKDQRASFISTCSKTVTQYKFDLMTINLRIFQSKQRGHQRLLMGIQEELTQSCHESLRQAVENRRQAMVARQEHDLKHKLQTFFDDAPTTRNE